MSLTKESLFPELEAALQREVAKAIEAAVEEAAEQVRVRIREKLGPIACSLFSSYQMERRGHDLVIRVRIGEEPKTP
jgi:hypothetical protein